MEKEIPKQNNEGLSRQQKIENFLLNPDKEIFNSLEEFKEAVDYIKSLVGNLDLNELENIQGEDGKNPELGVDYLTDEDLDKIDQFIQDRVSASWSSYPTKEEIVSSIENKVNSEVAKIPRVKGNPGTPGEPGKDGSPDTAEKILEKLRALPKNKKLTVSDVRGLQNELNKLAQDQESSIEDLLKLIDSLRITIPASSGGIANITGLIQQGANIIITGTGTTTDPFIISGSGTGGVTGPASAVNDNIAVYNLTTGKIIKDGGKKISELQPALGFTPENNANKDAVSGYAGLDGAGKINPLQLPALSITDTFVVASQAAMLALTAEVGDVAIRTDLNKTFILKTAGATILANWQELLTPTSAVTSVFGRSGVVSSQNNDYNADQIAETVTRVFVTPANKAVLENTSNVNTGDVGLVAGSNIVITPGVGTATISSTVSGGGANGRIYYPQNSVASDLAGYKVASTIPSAGVTSNVSIVCPTQNTYVLGEEFATLAGEPNTTSLPSGTAIRFLFASVSGGTAQIQVNLFQYKTTGNVATTGVVSLIYASVAKTITRASGSFIADGFTAGVKITVAGTVSNNGTYTVQAVSALTLTLVLSDVLVNETVGSTITTKEKLLRSGVSPTFTNTTAQLIQFFYTDSASYTLATDDRIIFKWWGQKTSAGGSQTITIGTEGLITASYIQTTLPVNLGLAQGTSLNLSGLTASQLVGTDASKNLVSLPVATYPSLAELAFVKGLTSNAQTQLTSKAPLASPTFSGIVTTAGQIKFPSVANPSTDVNTLDDYEEGTWTPDLVFGGVKVGITYTRQIGHYTKIGRMVFITFEILLSSKGTSVGNGAINGLPFTEGLSLAAQGGSIGYYADFSGAIIPMFYLNKDGTSLSLAKSNLATVGILTNTDFGNTTRFSGSGAFFMN